MQIRLSKAPLGALSLIIPITVFIILAIAGYQPVPSAIIALVCISASWFVHWGTEVDTLRRLQRTYYTVLGLSFGRWKPLPPIVGVTLKYFSSVSHNPTPSSSTSWGIWKDNFKRDEEVIIMLSIVQSSTGIIIRTVPIVELEAALEYAQSLAHQLGVPLNTYLPAHIAVKRA